MLYSISQFYVWDGRLWNTQINHKSVPNSSKCGDEYLGHVKYIKLLEEPFLELILVEIACFLLMHVLGIILRS